MRPLHTLLGVAHHLAKKFDWRPPESRRRDAIAREGERRMLIRTGMMIGEQRASDKLKSVRIVKESACPTCGSKLSAITVYGLRAFVCPLRFDERHVLPATSPSTARVVNPLRMLGDKRAQEERRRVAAVVLKHRTTLPTPPVVVTLAQQTPPSLPPPSEQTTSGLDQMEILAARARARAHCEDDDPTVRVPIVSAKRARGEL